MAESASLVGEEAGRAPPRCVAGPIKQSGLRCLVNALPIFFTRDPEMNPQATMLPQRNHAQRSSVFGNMRAVPAIYCESSRRTDGRTYFTPEITLVLVAGFGTLPFSQH